MIDYKSAWEHLKHYVSDMEFYTKPYKGNGFRAVLYKMEELEKSLTRDEPSEIIERSKDIKIGNYTLKRSDLQFTKEDFEEAKKAWKQGSVIYDIAHDLEQQLLDFDSKVRLEVDKWVFDAFKDICGCTTPDEVFNIMTTPLHIHRFMYVIETVNNKIKLLDICDDTFMHPEPGKLQYNPLHGCQLSVPTKSFQATEELRNSVKQRWEEIYNAN